MNKLTFHRDRTAIKLLPPLLRERMTQKGLIAPDHLEVQYCGFVSWHYGIAVFMPRNSQEGYETSENAFYLLQALMRYYFGKVSGVYEGNKNELIGGDSLSLASALVDDYLANGLYVRRKKHYSLNYGRTDWKRTISRHTPFPSGNSHVYLSFESSCTRYVSESETARIHARVIKEISRQYGVLLFGQERLFDERLETLPEPNGDFDTQVSELDRELTQIYSDRDIQLINMLKRFIQKSSETEGYELLVGTRAFHNVWEGMLDNCLPNKIDINNRLPVPYYLQDEHYHEVAGKGQRTDTVIASKDNKKWAVIDAKYYKAASAESAPGWPDLVKQFFYKTAAEEICGVDVTVTLHFIFPGTEHNLLKAKVGVRGQRKIAIEKFVSVEQYGEIQCHYCDPVNLIRKYVNSKKLYINDGSDITGQIFCSY
ncbi:LlaJI family restriction endonuclease [Glaciecola sp. 1036]|uniref:LlaJI family restriction endonuclease n=1 Tax=Alteromonadaceae TaxID=72275 RepID=UPI003D08B73E